MIFNTPSASGGALLREYENSEKPMREEYGLTVENGESGLKF